jgi:hypothetical protein
MENTEQNPRRPSRVPWRFLLARTLRRLPDTLDFFLRCAEQYGDVVDLTFGPRTYLLNNAEDIRHVLEVNHLN